MFPSETRQKSSSTIHTCEQPRPGITPLTLDGPFRDAQQPGNFGFSQPAKKRKPKAQSSRNSLLPKLVQPAAVIVKHFLRTSLHERFTVQSCFILS
jgi:hypothetical protein